MSRKRRTFSSDQKAKIALEALREKQSMSEIAQKHGVLPSQITQWKKHALDNLSNLFDKGQSSKDDPFEDKTALLYQQIGQLQFELDWLKKKSGQS